MTAATLPTAAAAHAGQEPIPRTLLLVSGAESRGLLCATLKEHRLLVVNSAVDAIREANARGFHGYVLERWLKDWSGLSMCREIRKIDPYAPILICAPTGEDERNRCIRAGADAVICKPMDPMALRLNMNALLSAADRQSGHAAALAATALDDELERRCAYASAHGDSDALSLSSVERTARLRAYEAFQTGHGTRAHFESWWDQAFQQACAIRAI